MKIIWTEADRKHYRELAWAHCKHLNAPRHMRMLMRDALAADMMEKAEASMATETAQEQAELVVPGLGRLPHD